MLSFGFENLDNSADQSLFYPFRLFKRNAMQETMRVGDS